MCPNISVTQSVNRMNSESLLLCQVFNVCWLQSPNANPFDEDGELFVELQLFPEQFFFPFSLDFIVSKCLLSVFSVINVSFSLFN